LSPLVVDPASNITSSRGEQTGIVELRRYKLHRRIERNPKAAKAAKSITAYSVRNAPSSSRSITGNRERLYRGSPSQAISSLNGGGYFFDVGVGFAVLCSNCHRMIYRVVDPSDLAAFRRIHKNAVCSAISSRHPTNDWSPSLRPLFQRREFLE
jgi:hypothetical protein